MDISLIVPVYNVDMYLEDCLNSLITQKFKGSYEIICINDGSTDDSLRILQKYKMLDPRIIVQSQENQGLSASRNNGLEFASGKYVMFIDSDDYLSDDDVLTNLFLEAEQGQLDILIADFIFDYPDKSQNKNLKRDPVLKNKFFLGRDFYDLAMKKKSLKPMVWNKLYLKSFLLNNSLFFLEGTLYEDNDFTVRALYLANKVKYIDRVVYMYRQRNGSIMNSDKIVLKDFFVIADSINSFNKKYRSPYLHNAELYMYIPVINQIKKVSIEKQKWIRQELIKRDVVKKFLLSNRLKCKIFSFICLLRILKINKFE